MPIIKTKTVTEYDQWESLPDFLGMTVRSFDEQYGTHYRDVPVSVYAIFPCSRLVQFDPDLGLGAGDSHRCSVKVEGDGLIDRLDVRYTIDHFYNDSGLAEVLFELED